MIAIVPLLVVGLLVLVVVASQRQRGGDRPWAPEVARPGRRARRRGGAVSDAPGTGWRLEGDVVRLAVEVTDGDREAITSLARRVAQDLLDAAPGLDRVTVVDRVGREVARVPRGAAATGPASDAVRASPTPRARVPSPVRPADGATEPRRTGAGTDEVRDGGSPTSSSRPFAERFTLPPAVIAACRDPSIPAEVVRAILSAAGRPTERRGDLVLSGPVAVAIADVRDDAQSALSRAYLRLTASGAPDGLVLVLGFVDPEVVRRRDRLAERVRYVDVDAVQRMADAVAAGLDPIAFAAPPRGAGA
jgi:hypothetical protein